MEQTLAITNITKPENKDAIDRLRSFWGKGVENNSVACEPAQDALLDQKAFRSRISKRITKDELSFLENADMGSLRELMAKYLSEANKQEEKHREGKSLIRSVGQKTVAFMNNFSGFLDSYSGIVEVMRFADSRYGGLAYGTLSALFIVAVNKKRMEDSIDATLLTMQAQFSRLRVIEEIHSSTEMKRYIANVYKLGIEFLREAIFYYSRPTYQRVWEALSKPPQLGVDQKIAAITRGMTEIDNERCILDSKRLYEMQGKLQQVQGEIKEVNARVEEVHTREEQKLLGMLQAKLVPDCNDLNKALEQYRTTLQETFSNIKRLPDFDMDAFLQREEYIRWKQCNHSCIMLLRGETAVRTTDLCWLSPAVIEMTWGLQRDKEIVAFHCCQVSDFMGDRVPAYTVLSAIIYQLLRAKPERLRDQCWYADIDATIDKPAWRQQRHILPFEVLAALLNDFQSAYILLDRVDQVKDISTFMEGLLKIVKTSSCRVKMLIVAPSDGRLKPEFVRSLQDDIEEKKFVSVGWDQT
ncbi:hypothetical protein GP486_007874 [Trichoglossum hirsutum]|uniref:Fungal STAND N-terminal Goodbye domain-containing protein n=1 Tax=Trichoglossum hirsutum TaxID=265104 RepID=A0A9P8IEQ5_9PEZI|nr:hypothetical protein GP486_007874 [Trichoglossum hirsutum]